MRRILAAAALAFCGCGGSETGSSADSCMPGDLIECPCAEGPDGIQECQDDGTWGECECGGDSDSDTDTDVDTDSDTDTDIDTDTDTDSDTDSDTDTVSDTNTDSETDTDSDTDIDTDTSTDMDTCTETETSTDSDIILDGGIDAGTESDAGLDLPDCEGGKYDSFTDLCWQTPKATDTFLPWDAISYCDDLELSGHTDWVLPIRQNYVDILSQCDDYVLAGESGYCSPCYESPICNALFGPEAFEAIHYWTSSPLGEFETWYWAVSYNSGQVVPAWVLAAGALNVRCVRPGP